MRRSLFLGSIVIFTLASLLCSTSASLGELGLRLLVLLLRQLFAPTCADLGADLIRDAFAEYQVPEAVLALKQGFGRLIRSRSDRGILAILDTRIQRMRYGKIFLESLPDYTTTQDLAVVARFMEKS